MALVVDKTYAHINMVDYQGNRSSMRLDLTYPDLAALYAAEPTLMDAAGVIPDLVAITDLKVNAVFLGVIYRDTGYGAAGSEVEEAAVISAKIVDRPGVYANLRVPGPKAAIFLPGPGSDANLVDREDADIIAWLANFEAGGPCFTSDGESIEDSATVGNWKGRRVFRKSRRRSPAG